MLLLCYLQTFQVGLFDTAPLFCITNFRLLTVTPGASTLLTQVVLSLKSMPLVPRVHVYKSFVRTPAADEVVELCYTALRNTLSALIVHWQLQMCLMIMIITMRSCSVTKHKNVCESLESL